MILTHSVSVCLATEPCDLRKSFDSLSVIVREQLKHDPISRKVFVFINKARNRIKLLYWDGTGLWVMAKRLEQGRFSRPQGLKARSTKLALKPEALAQFSTQKIEKSIPDDGIESRNATKCEAISARITADKPERAPLEVLEFL